VETFFLASLAADSGFSHILKVEVGERLPFGIAPRRPLSSTVNHIFARMLVRLAAPNQFRCATLFNRAERNCMEMCHAYVVLVAVDIYECGD